MRIDNYDGKILYELDKNSRETAQQIGKKVRLSKVSVIQRINKLKKEGAITNFITLINYRRLGFTNYHVYYSLQNLSQEKEEQFISFLKQTRGVNYILQLDSKWDLMLALFTESNEQTDKILNQINEKFGNFIKEIKIFVILTTFYQGRQYLAESKMKEFNGKLVREKSDKIKIDNIDMKILEAISLNARAQLVELEEITKIKAEVIRYRLKNLIEKEVIQRFTIDLDNEKFGNSFYKLLIKLNPNLKEEVLMNSISQIKSSLRIHHIMGEKVIEADFEVENDKEIREVIKNIKEKFGKDIQELEILPVYAVRKLNYCPI
jgi:Lrp/AsnC family transcriptional regulator, leucine-responsive regulatory protein